MPTRTSKGTASSKAAGSTLTISDVTLSEGATLVAALGYDDALGHPTSVKWGGRKLHSRIDRDPGGYDIAHSVWTLRSKRGGTRDLVATWSNNINERAMVAVELKGTRRIDVSAANNDSTATTTPTTGTTPTPDTGYAFALAFFVSEGPQNDTVTSGTIDDDGLPATATEGQRAGTGGAPPLSNITVQEMYLEMTSAVASQGDLVAGTARKFISSILLIESKIVYIPYIARTKNSGDDVMWCDSEDQGIGTGNTFLKWDGTGVNLNAVSDSEHKTAAIAEGLATADDVIILVDV